MNDMPMQKTHFTVKNLPKYTLTVVKKVQTQSQCTFITNFATLYLVKIINNSKFNN